MAAATAVFLEKGYACATPDDIIARSGGSRQTLYSLFGGKQGLFEALVADRAGGIFAPFVVDGLPDLTPDERRTDFGIRYLEAVSTPDAVGVSRLVLAEGAVMRERADRFWEAGPSRMRSFLATYFRGQTERGTLNLTNPDDAAHQFAGVLLGNFHMPYLLGLRPTPRREEIEAYVQAAVSRFLDGCRA